MKQKTQTQKGFVNFLEKQTDLPPISIAELPYIEISGTNHIEIDGIHKILEYKDDIIRIRFKKNTVIFNGESLSLRDFKKKNAIIEGVIRSIEFN